MTAPEKLSIRQVIDRLEDAARYMPQGMDAPVIVLLCDGTDAEGSRELEVDVLTWYDKDFTKPRDWAAVIKAHPHIERDRGESTNYPAVTNEADEALRKWTDQTNEGD